jgi:hypothetical protein
VKSVMSPTVSFADAGFHGSPVPQNEKEKKQALNNLTLRDSACRLQGGPA